MTPTIAQTGRRFTWLRRWIVGTAAVAIVVLLAATYSVWLPWSQRLMADISSRFRMPSNADAPTVPDDADRAHNAHEENSVELSRQAQKSIGLKLKKVQLTSFTRTVTVPGIVTERPGRSLFEVTAPLTGAINTISVLEGAAVETGQELFEIRLTHEEVVQAQSDMLKTVEELEVNKLEIQRLEKVTAAGVPGKTLLEREYEQRKLEALLRAQRQTLLLHGFDEQQVQRIEKERALLKTFTVYAPLIPAQNDEQTKTLQLETLKVTQGQHVNAGDTLAVLTDHSELFVEGDAFERDAGEVERTAAEQWPVTAICQIEGEQPRIIRDLKVLYVSTQINPDTRTLHFYVRLPNEKLFERSTPEGAHFVGWRYRPGQRMQLQVPVETWDEQIVLPVDAVAQDGPETYAFTADGNHFDRRPVNVVYRDSSYVVIANDGSIFAGDFVVVSSAQQLQLALKNKAGGVIDPHAGHNH